MRFAIRPVRISEWPCRRRILLRRMSQDSFGSGYGSRAAVADREAVVRWLRRWLLQGLFEALNDAAARRVNDHYETMDGIHEIRRMLQVPDGRHVPPSVNSLSDDDREKLRRRAAVPGLTDKLEAQIDWEKVPH